MASESVAIESSAPAAMAGHDSSVFMSWVGAISDLMLVGGDPVNMAEGTLADLGGLMYALNAAAQELVADEQRAARAKS